MVMAAELSRLEGLIGTAELERVRSLVRRAGLPTRGPTLAPQRLMELMVGDKKAAQGKLRFVLLESIGQAALRAGIGADRVCDAIVAAAQ
jgi:3-dehydroquinate synthase